MNKNLKNVILTLSLLFLVLLVFMNKENMKTSPREIAYSDFLSMLEPNSLGPRKPIGTIYKGENDKALTIEKETIRGYFIPSDSTDGKAIPFKTNIPLIQDELIQKFQKERIPFAAKVEEENKFLNMLIALIPWVLILGVIWFIMMRQLQATGNKAFSFGKSRAKMNVDSKVKVTFQDVAGCDEAKVELQEIIEFLKDPKKFQAIGARIPTGVLLVGPPGTGKTLLARAVAGEAGVPFFSISGSDFVEMFVGVGASRVRDLFDQGKKNAPCIIFIDEIDAVGRLRGAGLGGGHDEREQTLNQMLVEMDGFEKNEGIIVMAATNRVDVLDPALLRPGRFDRQVMVGLPDVRGREEILKVHSRKVPMTPDISLNQVARGTPGFTGADLANLINEAALLAARRNKKRVTQEELEEARDKVLMGPERRSFYISDKEKEVIAYHEAGHAILGCLLAYTEPVHKVTIIPRGGALGITQSLPAEEKHIHSKLYWLDQIVVAMGGYIAEELIFGTTSTGSSNDIKHATTIAHKMVCEWGMSEKLGTINYSGGNNSVFLGRDYNQTIRPSYSEEFAGKIDQEVKNIVESALNRGRDLIRKNKQKLDAIAKLLLQKETIDHEELMAIVHPANQDSGKKSAARQSSAKESRSKKTSKNPVTNPALSSS